NGRTCAARQQHRIARLKLPSGCPETRQTRMSVPPRDYSKLIKEDHFACTTRTFENTPSRLPAIHLSKNTHPIARRISSSDLLQPQTATFVTAVVLAFLTAGLLRQGTGTISSLTAVS